MQGVYRAADTISTVTTAEPLIYLSIPSTAFIEILSARVTCQNEVTSEQMHIKLARVASGTQAGGAAITAKPLEELSQAAKTTAKSGDTAITGLTMDGDDAAITSGGANKIAGWEYVPLPEERSIVFHSEELVLELLNTVTSCNLTAEIIFREIG